MATKDISDADRKKRLEEGLKKINKDHGKGTANYYPEMPKLDVGVISTGSLGLDYILGVGGIARGRITECYGLESSGKCLTADTYVWTQSGLHTVREIFESTGNPVSCKIKTKPQEFTLKNRYGFDEKTTHFTWNNRRPVFEVVLADGSSVKSTAKHPHLVMSERGNWVWKHTEKLQEGDFVVKMRGVVSPEENRFDSAMYAVGALVADGCFSSDGRVSFTNNDAVVAEHVVSFLENEGFSVKSYARNNTTEYHATGKVLWKMLRDKYGLSVGVSKTKFVPELVRSDYRNFKSFLQGYIDCESHIDLNKTTIEVISASKQLLTDAQQMLLCCGVHSIITRKTVASYPDNEYFRLCISGPSFYDYVEKVGFVSENRKKTLEGIYRARGFSNYDVIPHIKGLIQDLYDASETTRKHADAVYDYLDKSNPTYSSLDKILSLEWDACSVLRRLQEIYEANYVYIPVKSVEKKAPEPTFDFAMESTHSFIANGIVTHNTTVTLHAIAEAQKAGGTAAFIDAEHALDPTYAEALGVDMDNLVLSQPDSGEQALNVAEDLCQTGALDIIVIDSVAALVPQAEIDGETGDHHVGLQARMMSQFCRKISGVVSSTNTALVMINQIRHKIGVSWGSPNTTTGGNALKFYSSQRVEITRIGSLKKGDEIWGNRAKCKVVKNKVSPPFKQCEFDIIFGKGINKTGEIVDASEKLGLIEKAGAWYRMDGEAIGHGRDQVCQYLLDNPELANSLERQVRKEFGMIKDEESSD